MKIKKLVPKIAILVYLVLLGHFVFSNFVNVIGPNYTIKTTGYKNDHSVGCTRDDGTYLSIESCLCLGALLTDDAINVPMPSSKGFPFATNAFASDCTGTWQSYDSRDFNLARVLNLTYIFTVSGLFLVVYFVSFRKSLD